MLPQVNPKAAKEAAEQEVAKIKVPSSWLADLIRTSPCKPASLHAGAASDAACSYCAQSMIDKYKISEADVKGEELTGCSLKT